MGEHVGLDRAAGLAQLLPVGQLGDDPRALVPDRRGRVAEVRAQLRVGERRPGRVREALIEPTFGWTSREDLRQVQGPDAAPLAREAASDLQKARCVDGGADVAPVEAIAAHLSTTIAVEVSAFLSENVPPKPQHSSAPGQRHELETVDRREQPVRRVADVGHAQRVARRVVGHTLGERRADVRRPRAGARAARTARRLAHRSHPARARAPGRDPAPSPRRTTTARRRSRTRRRPGRTAAPARAPPPGSRCSCASARSTSARAGTRPRARAARGRRRSPSRPPARRHRRCT